METLGLKMELSCKGYRRNMNEFRSGRDLAVRRKKLQDLSNECKNLDEKISNFTNKPKPQYVNFR
jgi:hypothetical protein